MLKRNGVTPPALSLVIALWLGASGAHAQTKPGPQITPDTLGDLRSPSLKKREAAFRVIYKWVVADTAPGQMRQKASSLSPECRLALINLLDREADNREKAEKKAAASGYQNPDSYDESYSDYWAGLTEIVGDLNDWRALHVLLRPIVIKDGTINAATAGRFGENAVPQLLELYRKPNHSGAQLELSATFRYMLISNSVSRPQDKAAFERIFLEETRSHDMSVRLAGIDGLAEFHDQASKDQLIKLAQADPAVHANKLGRYYPVRDQAGRALKHRGGT